MNTPNPLLDTSGLPRFKDVRALHVLAALEEVLANGKKKTEKLFEIAEPTLENFIVPLADINERIGRVWGPVSHLNAVMNSDELREAYNAGIPKISEYFSTLKQDERLFRIYKKIKESPAYARFSVSEKKIVDEAIRDFRLAGAELSPEKKKRFVEVQSELSLLASKYNDHVLDDTNAFELLIRDEKDLSGLPDSLRQLAYERAVRDGKASAGDKVWKFTLEFPSYVPFMKYADSVGLRKKMYLAYMTRGTQGERDNTGVMKKLLELRKETALLTGYENFGEYSLATKMASSPNEVLSFLQDLNLKSRPVAQTNFDELSRFKKELTGEAQLFSWDVSYYSEKLREKLFQYTDEDVKVYFPEKVVLEGMFETIKRLYGFTFRVETTELWHPDAKLYSMIDESGKIRGQLMMDLYARPKKRGGAWMDECVSRKKITSGHQTPVAYLCCNFSPSVGGKPPLFTHDEVTTLFHEMGHVLHHITSKADYLEGSGINGVPWDGVELPSQFFENWCWEKDGMALIGRHWETGAAFPEDLLKKLRDSRNFLSGLAMLRQLEFAMLDMGLHTEFDPKAPAEAIHDYVSGIRKKVALLLPPDEARMENAFTHIFSGGYAAGYYSYKWAEVLSADAFSKFEENGLFDAATGRSFLKEILEKGGSDDFMECFVRFRGRKPEVNALLRQSGLLNTV
ncbi:MAG: M3 family metallopeptidase [Spirochaetia bacterium]|nr:M3 family metallopeptidase [Spirochaetia bacterium]